MNLKKEKKMKEIIRELEEFGECFIGTTAVQGAEAYKRFRKVEKAWNKIHASNPLAWDAETGIVWYMG